MKKYLQCVEKDAQNFVDTLLATIPKRTDDEVKNFSIGSGFLF